MRKNNLHFTFARDFSQDNNGTIENEELRGFLKDLLELVKKVDIIVIYNCV